MDSKVKPNGDVETSYSRGLVRSGQVAPCGAQYLLTSHSASMQLQLYG